MHHFRRRVQLDKGVFVIRDHPTTEFRYVRGPG